MLSEYPIYGPESIMARKAHGTCPKGVQLVSIFIKVIFQGLRICDGDVIRRLETESPATIDTLPKTLVIG